MGNLPLHLEVVPSFIREVLLDEVHDEIVVPEGLGELRSVQITLEIDMLVTVYI